jgi:trehalose 6-phosphate synthase/phosphatase
MSDPRAFQAPPDDRETPLGLRPEITEVPVTPGIGPATYNTGAGYFGSQARGLASRARQPGTPSHNPDDEKDRLEFEAQQRQDELADKDPMAAFPSLSLTGSVISATFCVPYACRYRKGQDWVRL